VEEIEVKFLDIDPESMEKKLRALGAVKKYDRIFKDRVFDFPGWPLDKNKSWLRLRDKGDKITLSFKKRYGKSKTGDAGLEEIEVVVSDFEKTTSILERLGMEQKFNEEKRRVHFELDSVDVDIDTWPLMPSYMEIEGRNWEDVRVVADKLGMDWEKRRTTGAMQFYREYGIEEKDYAVLTFDKQVKRK